MNPETVIEQAFVRWCKRQGIRCPKFKAVGERHWPDRMVLPGNGVVAFMEFKTDRGLLDRGQKELHNWLSQRGYTIHTPRSKNEAISLITNDPRLQ